MHLQICIQLKTVWAVCDLTYFAVEKQTTESVYLISYQLLLFGFIIMALWVNSTHKKKAISAKESITSSFLFLVFFIARYKTWQADDWDGKLYYIPTERYSSSWQLTELVRQETPWFRDKYKDWLLR